MNDGNSVWNQPVYLKNTLQWRHIEPDGVSTHQPRDCLLNRLFRTRKTSTLCVTGLCAGNHRSPVNSPHKRPVTRKMFPFDDVIMANIVYEISSMPKKYVKIPCYAVFEIMMRIVYEFNLNVSHKMHRNLSSTNQCKDNRKNEWFNWSCIHMVQMVPYRVKMPQNPTVQRSIANVWPFGGSLFTFVTIVYHRLVEKVRWDDTWDSQDINIT